MSDSFTPLNGGKGVTIACNTSSSSSVALPIAANNVVANSVRVNNTGVNYAFFALGDGTAAADLSYAAISPGDDPVFKFQFAGGSGAPTHGAAISFGGPTNLQITLGIAS